MTCRRAALVVLAGLVLRVPADAAPEPVELQIAAAASLRDVLTELAPGLERAVGVHVVFNFAGSGILARQILAANRADLFFSADQEWMGLVAAAGLVDQSSRCAPLGNRLVVIVPAGSALALRSARDLAGPEVHRLALADPDAVPAGRYARAWLESQGVWPAVAERVVPALDVRAALAAVASGGVQAGVVYRTDAAISQRVRVAFEVAAAEGPKISYALAALAGRPHLAAARSAVAWLCGPQAAPVFERYGFVTSGSAP